MALITVPIGSNSRRCLAPLFGLLGLAVLAVLLILLVALQVLARAGMLPVPPTLLPQA